MSSMMQNINFHHCYKKSKVITSNTLLMYNQLSRGPFQHHLWCAPALTAQGGRGMGASVEKQYKATINVHNTLTERHPPPGITPINVEIKFVAGSGLSPIQSNPPNFDFRALSSPDFLRLVPPMCQRRAPHHRMPSRWQNFTSVNIS